MKKLLLLLLTGSALYGQQTVQLSLDPGYINDVFFDFSSEDSQAYNRDNWDIAFYRVSAMNQGIRINNGKGLNLYEVSDDTNDWNNIDINAINNEDALYNSDTDWVMGAFNTGSATYGWGEYSSANHHVEGSVIFLIENAITNSYYKLIIEDYFGAYTIRYSEWNGTTWLDDVTQVIENSEGENKYFNYLNLETQSLVDASPVMSNWDLKFTKFSTMVTTNSGEQIPYVVTGVLQSPTVTVARVEEAETANFADIETLDFSEDINTIGYNWKLLNDNWVYEVVNNRVYYVKADNIVYRMYFTSFEGASTGNLSFVYEPENMTLLDIEGNTKFSVYPNPVKNNRIHIVYDNAKPSTSKAIVEIYNMLGQIVYKTQLNNTSGLFQKEIQLNNLEKGTYILRFTSGTDNRSEKLIIK